MKRIIILLLLFTGLITQSQDKGYEIKVTFKPFKNQFIYLGHYQDKQLPIIDSIKLNDKSEAVFKGTQKLPGGIYLVGYPDKSRFFEILIDKQQHFSVIADSSDVLNKISFQNSLDNALFNNYQKFMSLKGKEADIAGKNYAVAANASDSAKWISELRNANQAIRQYRENILKEHPDAMLSFLIKAMKEPEVPPADKHPGGKYDSLYAYNFYKQHFWDGVNFYDDRLIRTPFFESRLDKYFDQLVFPQPDSVIKEIDWMMGFAGISEEMQKFLLLKFVNRYLNQKYMWEDAVFVHLFEKYFAQKSYTWLTESGRKTITDRAYSLMSNILGNPAADIELPDTSGKKLSLYSVNALYVVVCIWDTTCGHCKELLPQLDSIYQTKWKKLGVKIYSMAKETDGSKEDWLHFIHKYQLQEWSNVYYSKEAEKARINAGIPGYLQLYDVKSFPTLYLLDKDKRIIAKKLTLQQIDEVLAYKLKAK